MASGRGSRSPDANNERRRRGPDAKPTRIYYDWTTPPSRPSHVTRWMWMRPWPLRWMTFISQPLNPTCLPPSGVLERPAASSSLTVITTVT